MTIIKISNRILDTLFRKKTQNPKPKKPSIDVYKSFFQNKVWEYVPLLF